MTIKQKLFGLAFIVILIAAITSGASSTLAQTSGNTTPTPNPQGTQGHNWNMYGMMWGNRHGDPMWTAVAAVLNMDVDTLVTQIQSGITLVQIAEAQGVDIQTVYDAVLAVMTNHMNAMIAAGYMTQSQVDTQLAWMRDHMTEMPMFTGFGFNPCPMGGMMGQDMYDGMMGGWNGMHGGMMGQGMMGGWDGMHGGMMGQHHGG